MAEGGKFSRSIEDGSDIVFEFECTPCAADGSRFEALQFCQTCNQFLCDTCTKYHKRFTKSHQLAPAGSTKHQKASKTTVDVPKCRIHPDRDIEMYCGTHDMVYCALCIAKEHRSCGDVEEVQNGVHKPNASRLQQLVADIDRVNKELHEIKGEKSRNVQMLKKKKVHLLKEIDKLRKEMNDHFDHLERKIKTELDDELAKSEQEIRDDITAADNLLTTNNARKADLACNTDDKHKFIAEKLCQNDVSAANAFLAKANLSKHVVFKFERNSRLYDCIIGSDNLGRVVTNSSTPKIVKRSKYVVKSSSERNVKVNTDESTCGILGMCQLQDGTIIMVDVFNNKLKRFDDQLNVKDHCNLKSSPFGLCSISPTEVVVRYKESMQFIHIGESLSPGKEVNIKPLGGCYNNHITLCDDKVWTTGVKCIHVYSTSGMLLKTIDRDSQGQQIFQMYDPAGIAVNNDGSKVYVTTWGDRVVVFNKNGDVIQEMRDTRLNETVGICITEDDIVLVTDWSSKNVVVFDSTGNSIGELVTSKDMLSSPRALCYDRMRCRLLVGFISNKIQIYELGE